MNLEDLIFFHTEKAVLVGWQLAIAEQKILKWKTQFATKMDEFYSLITNGIAQTFY